MSRMFWISALAALFLTGTATSALAGLEIDSTPTDEWTMGKSYQQSQTATGGIGELQWTVSQGSLPPGIELSLDGVLAGIPEKAGSYSFTLLVSDEDSNTATKVASIRINSPVSITTTGLPEWTINIDVTRRLHSSGGTGTITWSAPDGGLPDGIELQADGKLTGIPEKAGDFEFTVVAQDKVHATHERAISWIINKEPSLGELTLTESTAIRPFVTSISVEGGTAPFQWTIGEGDDGGGKEKGEEPGDLPAGLALAPTSGSTASITGKATESGTFTFDLTVEDVHGVVATTELTITIHEWPVMKTKSLAPMLAGVNYTVQIEAQHGTEPFRYRVTDGELPKGLALDSHGSISGVTDETGDFEFTVEALDAAGATAIHEFTLSVSPKLEIAPVTLPAWTLGVEFPSVVFKATGGSGAPVWQARSPLPKGMSVREDGTLSGTPTSAGDFELEIAAIDPTGFEVRTSSFLRVNERPRILTEDAGIVTQGRPVSVEIETQHGTAPFEWALVDGQLPEGVTLEVVGATATLKGTPTDPGDYEFTVEYRDRHDAADFHTYAIEVAAAPGEKSVDVDWTQGRFLVESMSGRPTAPPYQWRVVGGEAPSGLVVVGNGTAGQLTGTPQVPGEWEFDVEYSDDYGVINRWRYTVVINPPVSASGTPPVVALGRESEFGIGVQGGTPPYEFELIDGKLPPGVTLDTATGTILGSAEQSGAWPVEIMVFDASKAFDTMSLTIHVAAPFPTAGKASAQITGSGELHYWFLDAAKDGKMSLSVSFKEKGQQIPDFEMLSSAGTPVSVLDSLRVSAKGYRLRGYRVEKTDRYYVRLDNRDSAYAGEAQLRGRISLASRARATGTLSAPDFEESVMFAAPAGAVLGLSIRVNETIAPEHLRIVTPSGQVKALDTFGSLRSGGRVFKVSGFPVSESGDYELIVNVGGAGRYDAKIKLKMDRKAGFHLSD